MTVGLLCREGVLYKGKVTMRKKVIQYIPRQKQGRGFG
jgi:hypothetical protein